MEKTNTICTGLMKHVPEKWNLKSNMEAFRTVALNAANRGVKLFVTCECYLDGYCVRDNNLNKDRFMSIAQDKDTSPYLNEVREIARSTGMHIIFGFSLKKGNSIKNAALLVDGCGNDIGVYCKTHLYAHDLNYSPGDDIPVFKTELGIIGIMICADRRWPEVPRALKLKGADVIINPTYGMCHYANEWWMRTRAYENEIYLAFAHPQVSFICNPAGNVEAKLTSNISDVLVHDIDLSSCPDNTENYKMKYRRPELYGIITEEQYKCEGC